MKKLILSILFLLSIGLGIPPTQYPFDINSLYSNKLNDILKYDEVSMTNITRYGNTDTGWNLLSNDIKIWDGTAWVNPIINPYTYDANNN